jgi:hypothetical protein
MSLAVRQAELHRQAIGVHDKPAKSMTSLPMSMPIESRGNVVVSMAASAGLTIRRLAPAPVVTAAVVPQLAAISSGTVCMGSQPRPSARRHRGGRAGRRSDARTDARARGHCRPVPRATANTEQEQGNEGEKNCDHTVDGVAVARKSQEILGLNGVLSKHQD